MLTRKKGRVCPRRITYRLQASQVGLIEWTSQTSSGRAHAFHQEWNTERIEALAREELNERQREPVSNERQ